MTSGSLNVPRPPPALPVMDDRPAPSAPREDPRDFAPPELERLARACLHSLEAALVQVDHWRARGHDLEEIYIHGVAPSARLLGHWWLCDAADFAQVTIGSANLQRLLHRLSQEFCAPGADQPCGLNLLLACEPRAQHTLGAFMLGEFFRRRGWSVQWLTPQDGQDILAHLRRDWFDAVALSVSTDGQMPWLREWLPRLRAQSPNPELQILLGGPLALQHAQPLRMLGADLVATDARETVNWISQHMLQVSG
ncbi:MAG: B12-binding domain-containing protein [Limnohabitans sp.]